VDIDHCVPLIEVKEILTIVTMKEYGTSQFERFCSCIAQRVQKKIH
jgi:hypothetical protein